MGLYNVIINAPPFVTHFSHGVQFKWGHCWMHNYRLGDTIIWDDHRPLTADRDLEVSGIGDHAFFAIRIRNDVVIGLRQISEAEYDQLDKVEPRLLDRLD